MLTRVGSAAAYACKHRPEGEEGSMGQEWDEDPESMINQSAPAAAKAAETDSSSAVADDDGSFSPELFDEDEVCM
mgnify:CR=1 FL=1